MLNKMHFLKNCWSFFDSKGLTKPLDVTRFSEDHTLNSAEERVSWRSADGVETQDGLRKKPFMDKHEPSLYRKRSSWNGSHFPFNSDSWSWRALLPFWPNLKESVFLNKSDSLFGFMFTFQSVNDFSQFSLLHRGANRFDGCRFGTWTFGHWSGLFFCEFPMGKQGFLTRNQKQSRRFLGGETNNSAYYIVRWFEYMFFKSFFHMIQMCEMRLFALEAIDYRCLFCRLFFDRWLENFQRPDTSDIGRFKSSSGWKASGCSSNRNFESTRMVDGQTNNNPEEGMKFIYCRSLVVTSILRCGRSISSQSSSSFQKTKKQYLNMLLNFTICFQVFEKRKHLIQDVKTMLSVKPVIHEMPACFMISFLERCGTYLNFDER